MALDPKSMRPADVVRLLNSTTLGTVLTERQLYRHRTRAGFRIGNAKTIHLIRYLAWLFDERHRPQPAKPTQDYGAKKEAARKRNADIARAGRDIAPIPEVVDPQRKAAGKQSFRHFCEHYFPSTFHLAWSPVHLRMIHRIEHAVLHGGLFASSTWGSDGK